MTEQDVILLIGAVMIAAIVIGGILLWPSWRDAHIEQVRLMAEMRNRTDSNLPTAAGPDISADNLEAMRQTIPHKEAPYAND